MLQLPDPGVRWPRGNIRTISGTGACLLTANRATDSYYSAVTLTQSTTATKATPVVSWKPASIQLGHTLDWAQLDATSTVAGTFAYTPPSGTQVTTNSLTVNRPTHSSCQVDVESPTRPCAVTISPAPKERIGRSASS